jgi:hypothetical protein
VSSAQAPTIATSAWRAPKRCTTHCATLSAAPLSSMTLPNTEPSRKTKNQEATKPVKPPM